MNLYIHIEVSAREEDSTLLKAVLAAHSGYDVLIGISSIYNFLFKWKFLNKGIFHTKSLEHNNWKKNFLKLIYSQGNKITSLDEEAAIIKDKKSLENFLKSRFTNDSLSRVSKIFCWGVDDFEMLKKFYPNYSNKFLLTGTSRADMWNNKFINYWATDEKKKDNKVMFSLNFPLVNGYVTFEELINNLTLNGYFERSKNLLDEIKKVHEITKINFNNFKKLIPTLAEKLPKQHFIVRPHPSEKSEIWSKLLSKYKNIEVNNSGNFNQQLFESKILIHNSCTTAFQASIINKKVICYNPSRLDHDHGRIANKLGYMCFSIDDLINEIEMYKIESKYNIKDKVEIEKKIHTPNNKHLSSNLIINTWIEESKIIKFRKNKYHFLKFILFMYEKFSKYMNLLLKRNILDYKFQEFDKDRIKKKIYKIEKILNLENKSKVIKISKNCLLIKNDA